MVLLLMAATLYRLEGANVIVKLSIVLMRLMKVLYIQYNNDSRCMLVYYIVYARVYVHSFREFFFSPVV